MARQRASRRPADIDLHDFSALGPLLDKSARGYYGTGASFCLRHGRRRGAILLSVELGGSNHTLCVAVHAITNAIRQTFADHPDAAEHGAYGVALLTAAYELGLRFAARSYKTTGFDFFMSPPGSYNTDPDDIFKGKWGLEVSGILKGDESDIHARLRAKRNQVADALKLCPVLVAIVEFSRPIAILELRQ